MELKSIGKTVGGIIVFAVVLAIPVVFLLGMAQFSLWALEWAPLVLAWMFWISVLLLIPLAFIPPTRGFSANGLLITSYIFGAILWVYAIAFTYEIWGLFAVIVGLLILGVGVVPIAILAALLNGYWDVLGSFAFLIFITFGSRLLAYWLAEKVDARAMKIAEARIRIDPVIPARRVESNDENDA